jgi:hypothetical protein
MRSGSMSTHRWAAPIAVALLGTLAACATPGEPPVAQMIGARASIAQAESAEAASREKRFEPARRWSELAEADAELAERKARAVKAQAAVTELARSNDMLREELERKSPR